MIRGLYTAASGMMLQMQRQDVVANNIANANSSGYKKDTTVNQAFPDMLISRVGETNPRRVDQAMSPVPIGPLGTGAAVAEIVTDFSTGKIQMTENSADLAIGSQGFFAVLTPAGERFTRDGAFKINAQGLLVTNDGYYVLDRNNQAIAFQDDYLVDEDGRVLDAGHQLVAQLKVVEFDDPRYLRKEGGVMNSSGQNYRLLDNPDIKQGYLELSNVNAIQEMVNLINVVRAYESCQKVIQAEDEITGIAINQVGSIS